MHDDDIRKWERFMSKFPRYPDKSGITQADGLTLYYIAYDSLLWIKHYKQMSLWDFIKFKLGWDR